MSTNEGWPAGIEARPIDKADAPAWAELLAAKEKADSEGENYDADDLLEELADPKLDAARDTIGLWSGGELIGYGVVRGPDLVLDVHRVRTEGTVHPQWRRHGIGSALLPWLVRRAGEFHRERQPGTTGEINTGVITTNAGAEALLTGAGFEKCRYFFDMTRPFDQPITELPAPEGLRLVGFSPEYDEPLRLAHNEVFLDHWGSTPKDAESWKTWFTGSRAFRGNLSYLVLDGDEIVTYTLGYEYVADTEATGIREVYVGQVGTKRSHRGRRLAAVALSRVMAEAERAGFQRASLGVDAENPTGALGLYEHLGFTTKSTWATYRLPIT
ncbi:mycothiol synthase [Kribbella amoyensis]|uniref:Mycothiol synthase n=1 Tax=Kribbella amoyensis TaxID=996641 RepID=A0A561BQD2_9ACTN|nr:GNAT family N-acetyltransferase [Kribbella amoyensis]TWD81095.1 mycothiol synthase [Kribbella amoyensis]